MSSRPGSARAFAPRPVAGSVDELLAGATRRTPYRSADARSSARFERVELGGVPHVVKYLHLDDDLMMRAAGDIGCLPLRVWATGITEAAPDVIDHAIIAAASGVGRNGWGAAILMRDVTAELVPPGDDPVPAAQHARFLDHLAALSARMWGWQDHVGLLPYATRWAWFGPGAQADLGTGRDGRTILLDWAYPGAGPVCHELGWYLALNRARLPLGHTKESTITAFRDALERHGVPTAGWWETQLRLALLGTVLQLGWEKALGDDTELGWWCDRAREGLAAL